MDASRLASVATDIVAELDEWQVREKLQVVRQTLQQSISSPAAAHDQEFRDSLGVLTEALRDCPSSTFRPSEAEILAEIGAGSLVGDRLAARVTQLVDSLGATPSLIKTELDEIATELEKLHITLSTLISTFSMLDIEPDSLGPGEGEIGVIIPLSFGGNRLETLRDELQLINNHLKVFPQLFDEKSNPLEIRSISTRCWEVFLVASPFVVDRIAITIERIVGIYKSVLQIRQIKETLAKGQVDPKASEYVEQRAKELVEQGIEELHAELLAKAIEPDPGRSNELTSALSMTLRYLADRIDSGIIFEAAVGYPDEEEEGDEAGAPKDGPSPDEVRRLVSSMAQLERAPQPVLKLSGTWQDAPEQMTMDPPQGKANATKKPEAEDGHSETDEECDSQD